MPGGSGNGTGTVTLTGTAAAINTALAGASYTGNLNFHGTDTLSVTTTDGGGHSSGAHTAAITVAGTAVITETVAAASGNENTAIPLSVSVSDTNTGDTLTTVLTVTNGTLSVPGGSGNGTGTVTLTGTAAAINTALAGASYTGNLNFHGTDTLSVTTTDGGGHSSGAHTAALTVADTAVVSESVPPALSGNENTAISLAGVSVADTPNTGDTLTTVLTVTNGTLSVPGGSGNGTGTVTLTGTAAAINTALAGASYTGNLNFHGTDTLSVTTTDGGGHSSGAHTAAITVADTAVVSESVPPALSGNENTAISLAGVSVADTPNTGDTLTTVLTVSNGTLSVPGGSGNGTGTVTLTGTAAAINTALAGASYTGNLNFHGTDTLSVTTTDGGGHSSGAQTAAITVAGTAVITETVAAASGNENTAIPLSVSVSDSEHGRHADDGADGTNGTLSVPGGSGNGTGTVTLTGTAAAINTALAGASYTGNLNFHGTDTLSVTTTDGGGHSSGAHTAAITVADTAVISESVPPALSGNENTAISLAGVSVADTPNTGDTLTTVLTVSNGTITVATPGGIVANNGTGTVTLTGTAAAINTALAGASYTGNLNFHGTDTLSVTTTDGGGHSSGAQTAAITVADTAVITETVAAASGNENTAIPLGVSVSDTNTGDTLTTVLTVQTAP